MQCQHGEVITLFGIAHEISNRLGHLLNESAWLGRCCLQYFFNPFLAKHLALGILGLIQTVGIEEECGAWCERCLLLRKRPVRHGSYRQIPLLSLEQRELRNHDRLFVACIAVAQPSGIKVEHPSEEGDKDGHAGVACHHVVHAGHDTLWLPPHHRALFSPSRS